MAGSENGAGQPVALLQIAIMSNGSMSVNYPSLPNGAPDEMKALYMLERGRMLLEDAIRKAAEGASQRIIPVAGDMMPRKPMFG